MKKIYLLLLVLVTMFAGCKEDREVEFTTFEIVDEKFTSSYTSVDLNCKVRCAATIKKLYLQYDTVTDFSTYQEVELVENEKTEVYSVKIDDLLDNTTYYVRYVAVNSYSQVTSEEVSEFKTLQATVPTIEVREITDVLDTIATVGFVLKFNGGADITKIGICWSVDSVPTIDNVHVKCSSDVVNSVSDGDLLFLNISGLEENTTYYVRAYAENKMGIDYSDSKSFITLTLPDVKTGKITDIQSISALLNGEALFDGNDSTTIYGFCWGEELMPTIEGNYIQVAKESFSYKLSNLNPETTYYVRAFAKNKIGVVYGEEISFRTLISDDFYDYVCEGYDYVGYGFSLNSADIKGDTVLLRIDNDSIITLYIEYIPSKVVDTTVIISEGDYYEFGGLTLTSAGKYTERFITSLGCDSIVNLTLKVGYEYVDLGLSVKWATCNVGATKPEGYGDYFAWGEVEPKGYYDWSTYKYCDGTYNTLTKYCNNSDYGKYGFTDNKTILDPEDDAATVNWGDGWRMPTVEEQTELREKCKWTWITQNGVNGYKVVGPNGNSIFLPAAGGREEEEVYGTGSYGTYRSSSLNPDDPYGSYFMILYPMVVSWGGDSRFGGRSIRPVYGELSHNPETRRYIISVHSIEDSYGTVSGGGMYDAGSQVTITATANSGYRFKEWNDGNTDNPRVITVTKDAIYTAHFEEDLKQYTISVYSHDNSRGTVSGGGTYNEGSQVTITATAKSGYKFKEWNDGNTDNPRVITVMRDAIYTAHFEAEKNLNAGHEYVDLGLPSGLKWATCNVGATTPEEYGDYFAWGEVESKTTYNRSTYKYCNGSLSTLTKYCNNSSYGNNGFTDNKTVLDPEDDAATANWGGSWRMPTNAEFIELREKCTWTWITQSGVKGYKVVGPNGNSIFLPAAGWMVGGSLNNAGSNGDYWSSSLSADRPNHALYVSFNSDSVDRYRCGRDYGYSVRPVCL